MERRRKNKKPKSELGLIGNNGNYRMIYGVWCTDYEGVFYVLNKYESSKLGTLRGEWCPNLIYFLFVVRILSTMLENPSEFNKVKLAIFDRGLFVQVVHLVLSESIAQSC